MLKKFLSGALFAVMLLGFGAFAEASQTCGGNYYCASDCDSYGGEYCGRYGCRR